MRRFLFTCVVLGALAALLPPARAFELPSVFSDHMVLQRDRPVAVWGQGDEGEKVRVTLAGQTKEGAATGGRWQVELDPLPAGGPHEMRVESAKGKRELHDVWAGEVWVLAGQSNMRWQLGRTVSVEASEAIAQADSHPRIRLFDQSYAAADTRQPDVVRGKWTVAGTRTAPEFSTVGYYFAVQLEAALDVPVGLVQTAVGGTMTRSWMSREFMARDPFLQKIPREYDAGIPAEKKRYAEQKAAFDAKAQAARDAGQRGPDMPGAIKRGPLDETSQHRPAGNYYARVAPLQPLTVRGVIWYQGESNAATSLPAFQRDDYARHLAGIIANWRADWGRDDLPFLVVQLPAFGAENFDFPLIRQQQEQAVRQTKNTALIVAIDTGEAEQIHPADKSPVGRRLADTALRYIASGELRTLSPLFEKATAEGGALLVGFDQVGGGLVKTQFTLPEFIGVTRGTPPDEMDLPGFEVAGEDGQYRPARAVIAGEGIRVASEEVSSPASVRYLWTGFPETSPALYTKEGQPVAPFRFPAGEVAKP